LTSRKIRALWLGRRSYEPIHALQELAVSARQQGSIGDTLLLLEHNPVVTLGRGAKQEHLLLSKEHLRSRGIDLVQTLRGGDVTYHGPGQLVGYPIVDLAPDRCDVRRYVRDLLSMMIGLAADYGLDAGMIDRYPGIWVDTASPHNWGGEQEAKKPAKLGAVGVRISRWVTMHGFAFNACPNLSGFDVIVPCGIREFDVTSIQTLTTKSPHPNEIAHRAASLLSERMDAELTSFEAVEVPDAELAEAIGLSTD